MSIHLVVHAGPHRGIWVREEQHRDAVWRVMRHWPSEMKAIAATFPVRICPSAEGWEYLQGLVTAEREFSTALKGLGKEVRAELSEDRLPEFLPSNTVPRAPSGEIPHFREEWQHDADGKHGGVGYYSVDGKLVGGGVF